MESDKLMLLAQLADSMEMSADEMEKAYIKSDKKRFELANEAILDFQNKISFLLRGEK